MILQSESENKLFKEKMDTLNNLFSEFKFELNLYTLLKRNIRNNTKVDVNSVHDLVSSLPRKLKYELSDVIYKSLMEELDILKGKEQKDKEFKSWLCPLLRTQIV